MCVMEIDTINSRFVGSREKIYGNILHLGFCIDIKESFQLHTVAGYTLGSGTDCDADSGRRRQIAARRMWK